MSAFKLPIFSDNRDSKNAPKAAKGFTMGYFGSMILLIMCLLWTMIFDGDVRYCFIFVGLWWVGFSQITYNVLPDNVYNRSREKGIIWKGFNELKIVFKQFRNTVRLKRFITSFFFFNTGVQTVMLMATLYASREIFKIPEEVRIRLSPEEIADKEAEGTTGLIISILLNIM